MGRRAWVPEAGAKALELGVGVRLGKYDLHKLAVVDLAGTSGVDLTHDVVKFVLSQFLAEVVDDVPHLPASARGTSQTSRALGAAIQRVGLLLERRGGSFAATCAAP